MNKLIKLLTLILLVLSPLNSFSQYDSTTYYLSTPSVTSAGVYQNGRLIRTLWSNQTKSGTFIVSWNRKNDSNVNVTGAYQIRVIANNLTAKWKANIGNTSRDSVGPNKIRALRTPTDGVEVGNAIYFSTGFVEGNSPTFKILKNNIRRMVPVRPSQCGDADARSFILCY
jgi:hypothetical protein